MAIEGSVPSGFGSLLDSELILLKVGLALGLHVRPNQYGKPRY